MNRLTDEKLYELQAEIQAGKDELEGIRVDQYQAGAYHHKVLYHHIVILYKILYKLADLVIEVIADKRR